MKSARDRDTKVAFKVACNPNAPGEALIILANRFNIGILLAVAGNKNTPAEALAKLARKNNRDVKLLVVRHENTSRETLEFLFEQAADTDEEIFQVASKALIIQ